MVLNFFNWFAISIFVPTPSVLVTICGPFSFLGIAEIAPNPPIFLKLPLLSDFLEIEDICFTNLSAFLMLTPIF